MSTEKHTFSVEEAARMIGIGRQAMYELVRTGGVSSVKIGRRVVIPRRALEKLLGEEAPPVVPSEATASAKVLWKPCPCCEGTGVIGVKPRSDTR